MRSPFKISKTKGVELYEELSIQGTTFLALVHYLSSSKTKKKKKQPQQQQLKKPRRSDNNNLKVTSKPFANSQVISHNASKVSKRLV